MNRGLSVVLGACVAAALLTGCGASESESAGAGANSSAASSPATGPRSRGFQTTETPKFAKPPSSAPVQSGVVQIAYRNIAIDPDTLKVKVGTTIKWTNYDSVEHNVVSVGGKTRFKSENFGESGTYEVKLTKPGVIHYECTIHPATMNGTIEVVS